MLTSMDKELVCIIWLGVSFMFLFASDTTMQEIQKVLVNSMEDDHKGFTVEGYTVKSLTYTLFAASLWFGPYVNYALGAKITLAISALGYLLQTGSFLIELAWVIYTGAVIGGMSSGILWPAQGHYMIENSTPQTTTRNVAIFWSIFKLADLLGNSVVYFTFHGKKYVDQRTRRVTIVSLMVLNSVAIGAFLFIPKSVRSLRPKDYGPITTMKKSWNILFTPKMLWLTLPFSYVGIQQSFGGIYSSSIGFTLAFGDSAKELLAMGGIVAGIGALLGGLLPFLLADVIIRNAYARRIIMLAGCTGQLLTFLFAVLNLPNDAVFDNTEKLGFIKPIPLMVLTGCFFLGFGDSCFNTQILSIIGDNYRHASAEGVALYKFFKAVFIAITFLYSSHLGLHVQTAILVITAVVGTIGFFVADHDYVPIQASKHQLPQDVRGTMELRSHQKNTD